jgi:hypothetical protein
MIINPDGLPTIRLHYKWENAQDGSIETKVVDETIVWNHLEPNVLSFEIDDRGKTEDIDYDIQKGLVMGNSSFIMMNFTLIKNEADGEFFYTGTLINADIEEGFYNINITGYIGNFPPIKTLPHLTIPA